MMWFFLRWGLREEERNDIVAEITQRMESLPKEFQAPLRELWGDKDKPDSRLEILGKLNMVAREQLESVKNPV